MGQQDNSEKLLEEHNDVFADIINVNLYGGSEILHEEELQPATARSQYKADDGILHENERDISKYWNKGGVTFALYAIENQTNTDKKIPLRIIAYDGANYRSQLLNEKAKHFYPCISVVLYFGMKRWDTAKSLKEILDIPEELEPYVNDYRIHVIEVAWLTDEQVRMYKSDFRVVAEFFTQKRKNEKYHPTPQVLKHVDEVLKLLSVFGGANELEKTYQTIFQKEKRGDITMCEFIQRTINEGVKELFAEELPKRMAEELPKRMAEELPKYRATTMIQFIEALQKNLNCTLAEALAYLNETFEDYTQAVHLLRSASNT